MEGNGVMAFWCYRRSFRFLEEADRSVCGECFVYRMYFDEEGMPTPEQIQRGLVEEEAES
jgi:hypothetical protein